jgi:hypothetical protein
MRQIVEGGRRDCGEGLLRCRDGLKAAGVSTIEQPAREALDKGAPLAEVTAMQRVLEPEVIVIVAPIVPIA